MSNPLADDPNFVTHAIDPTAITMKNVAGASATKRAVKLLPELVVQEFLDARAVRTARVAAGTPHIPGTYKETPPTPLLDDIAEEMAAVLRFNTLKLWDADTLRQQFILALTWKIHDAIHDIEPDPDGDYAGYSPLREGGRAAIRGDVTTKVNGHPML